MASKSTFWEPTLSSSSGQIPHDEDRDGVQNTGLVAIYMPDSAASP